MLAITAIMPTRGRQQWARQALESFINQSYERKRIIILDDEDDPSFEEISGETITHVVSRIRYNIPEKMNQGCQKAEDADIIIKWDSDDWYAMTRIEDQVERLQQTQKSVTTYNSILFHQSGTERAFRYSINQNWGTGTSLAFRRSFWDHHRFNERKIVGSDNDFIRKARDAHELDSIADAHKTIVARIHDDNTSVKRCIQSDTLYYQSVSIAELPDDYLAWERTLV